MDQFASPPVKNKQLNNDSFTDLSVLSNKNNNAVNENINDQSKLSEVNNSQAISTNAEQENKYQYFLNLTLLSLSPIVNVSKIKTIAQLFNYYIYIKQYNYNFIYVVFSSILRIRYWKTL